MTQAPQTTGILAGKRGLVMGVANNRSIAWGIAKAVKAMVEPANEQNLNRLTRVLGVMSSRP